MLLAFPSSFVDRCGLVGGAAASAVPAGVAAAFAVPAGAAAASAVPAGAAAAFAVPAPAGAADSPSAIINSVAALPASAIHNSAAVSPTWTFFSTYLPLPLLTSLNAVSAPASVLLLAAVLTSGGGI